MKPSFLHSCEIKSESGLRTRLPNTHIIVYVCTHTHAYTYIHVNVPSARVLTLVEQAVMSTISQQKHENYSNRQSSSYGINLGRLYLIAVEMVPVLSRFSGLLPYCHSGMRPSKTGHAKGTYTTALALHTLIEATCSYALLRYTMLDYHMSRAHKNGRLE